MHGREEMVWIFIRVSYSWVEISLVQYHTRTSNMCKQLWQAGRHAGCHFYLRAVFTVKVISFIACEQKRQLLLGACTYGYQICGHEWAYQPQDYLCKYHFIPIEVSVVRAFIFIFSQEDKSFFLFSEPFRDISGMEKSAANFIFFPRNYYIKVRY